jgi:hypothetical protein
MRLHINLTALAEFPRLSWRMPVLLVDDHGLVGRGFRRLLEDKPVSP